MADQREVFGPEHARALHEMEQQVASAREMARILKLMYDSFVGEGFNPVQALTLTANYHTGIINASNQGPQTGS